MPKRILGALRFVTEIGKRLHQPENKFQCQPVRAESGLGKDLEIFPVA